MPDQPIDGPSIMNGIWSGSYPTSSNIVRITIQIKQTGDSLAVIDNNVTNCPKVSYDSCYNNEHWIHTRGTIDGKEIYLEFNSGGVIETFEGVVSTDSLLTTEWTSIGSHTLVKDFRFYKR